MQHWESRGLRLVRAVNTSALNCARAVQYRNKNKVPAFTVIYTSPHSLGPGKIQSSEFVFEPTHSLASVSVPRPGEIFEPIRISARKAHVLTTRADLIARGGGTRGRDNSRPRSHGRRSLPAARPSSPLAPSQTSAPPARPLGRAATPPARGGARYDRRCPNRAPRGCCAPFRCRRARASASDGGRAHPSAGRAAPVARRRGA